MNTDLNNLSIEEIKAALQAKENALYEEKQALLRKERELKAEQFRVEQARKDAEELLRWENTAKSLVEELKAVGFTQASYSLPEKGKYPNVTCLTNERYSPWNISFESAYKNYETKIVVGQYGETSRYPVLKAGGFNYKKIAATAWEKYQGSLAKQKRANTEEENKASNKARITRLATQFGTPAYKGADYNKIDKVDVTSETYHSDVRGHSSYSYRTDNDLMLKVDHITEENAAKLIRFMIENSMIEIKES